MTLSRLNRQTAPARTSLAGIPRLGVELHGEAGVAQDEVGDGPFGFADDLDAGEALQDLLPKHAQLKLGGAVAHAAVDAEAEGDVVPGTRPVDEEVVRPLDHLGVA